jgi:hypothetical protein
MWPVFFGAWRFSRNSSVLSPVRSYYLWSEYIAPSALKVPLHYMRQKTKCTFVIYALIYALIYNHNGVEYGNLPSINL